MADESRLDQIENHLVDMRLAISALLNSSTRHQRDVDVVLNELREMRIDMNQIQTEIRDLQQENRRILDVLQGVVRADDAEKIRSCKILSC